MNWSPNPADPRFDVPPPSTPTVKKFRKLLAREEQYRDEVIPPDPPPAPDNPQAGRDAKGRWAKGNKGGTGNPFARQCAALRQALLSVVTENDIVAIACALLAQARQGDVAAARLLFSYVMGKPTEAPDPDRLDLDDWKLLQERLCPLKEDWEQIKTIVPVEGLVEAGHRVADLRAETWRAEVLRPGPDPEPPKEGESGRVLGSGRQPDMLREALAMVQEEEDVTPEWKARVSDILIRADEAGCLQEVLLKLGAEPAQAPAAPTRAARPVPPSPNGCDGHAPPSPNGSNGHAPPSANGDNGGRPPSPNGGDGPGRGAAAGEERSPAAANRRW